MLAAEIIVSPRRLAASPSRVSPPCRRHRQLVCGRTTTPPRPALSPAGSRPMEDETQSAAATLSKPDEQQGVFERWQQSFDYLTGALSADARRSFEDTRDATYAKEQAARCEALRETVLKHSPIVVFLNRHLRRVGCPMGVETIRCMPCDNTQSGGFHPDLGIMLCQNRLPSRRALETTLAHEMIHAFDQCQFHVDWNNLKHHACSEVRAASLSGDCRWTREFFARGHFNFTKQHQACVRRRATLSVRNNPSCNSEQDAILAVNTVFDACFRDTRYRSDHAMPGMMY